MRRILLLATVAAVMVAMLTVMAVGPALAQLTVPHQHELSVPGTGEQQQIAGGTGKCGANLTALNEVHSNVHLGQPPLVITAQPTTC